MYGFGDFLLWVREHFNQRVDRMTMLASVEGRVPYQNNAVVELGLSISMSRKLQPGRLKWLLADAFADVIPEVVLKRSKRPFAAPIQAWSQGSLRSSLEARLDGQALARLNFLDGGRVRAFTQQFFQQLSGQSKAPDRLIAVWSLFALSAWAEHYRLTA